MYHNPALSYGDPEAKTPFVTLATRLRIAKLGERLGQRWKVASQWHSEFKVKLYNVVSLTPDGAETPILNEWYLPVDFVLALDVFDAVAGAF